MTAMGDASEALRLLAHVETATIGHFLADGFMAPEIQCLVDGVRVCGPAITVSLPGDDGSALSRALSDVRSGAVLVVDRCGDDRHACWGAVLTAAAQAAGIVGVVIDGFVTDVGAIRASGLPVWCRGRSPLTTKLRGGGAVGGEIRCGGIAVRPGDLVLADENGVLALEPEGAAAVALRALALQAAEPAMIARLLAGETLAEIRGIEIPGSEHSGQDISSDPFGPGLGAIAAAIRLRPWLPAVAEDKVSAKEPRAVVLCREIAAWLRAVAMDVEEVLTPEERSVMIEIAQAVERRDSGSRRIEPHRPWMTPARSGGVGGRASPA